MAAVANSTLGTQKWLQISQFYNSELKCGDLVADNQKHSSQIQQKSQLVKI